jgi:myo-inositol-1(or 4)-monophosphatase
VIADFMQAADEAARLGGQVLRTWSTRFTVTEKSRSNLVTEADFASQKVIHEFLHRRYPHHGFLGEEGLEHPTGAGGYRWVIDPLDGTSNYVHGFPYYAVSIGLEEQGELIAAAIYDPTRDEMFLAGRGLGATLNRRRLKTSGERIVGQAMLVASLPVATTAEDPAVGRFLSMIPKAQTVQRTGSAALNLAYVAAGRLDGFWSASLKPWDMAAGVLLVREAGGVVTTIRGGSFELEVPDLLAAATGELQQEMVRILA